ncbi:MAG TPA: hypothetical protein DCP57_07260 [Gammaproteobacteria bacterium]|nr:MAG: SufD family Fe-S cluster assembly protein [Gammaproteobacteria bacterium TMED134]RZO71658.1 MAG: SufD family Fe-S cluster assembly protein [OM182 bacterium]HAL42228.1 hypothetical protein [Gammaproteobacteria bacterium]
MADLVLPQGLSLPSWMQAGDQGLQGIGQIDSVLQAALDSPQFRERWKYTRPRPLLEHLEDPQQLPVFEGVDQEGITLTTTAAPSFCPRLEPQHAPEATAKLCLANTLIVIEVVKPLTEPLRIQHKASSQPVLLRLHPGAEVALEETYAPGEFLQQAVWIELEDGARLSHARNTFEAADWHWQYLYVHQAKHSAYSLHNYTTGTQLRRQDIHLVLDGEGCEAKLLGAARIDSKTTLDQHINVEHRQAMGNSEQKFHHVVADGGKSTFNSRIHIHPNARGSAAILSNKNLGLGQSATINTKPELEIYNDDVQCAHGATIGRLSDDEMFYFTSRGIASPEATALLSRGFLNQCIQGALAEAASNALTHVGITLDHA